MASQQTQSAHSGSIFSQKLDRAAFTAYFLVVPNNGIVDGSYGMTSSGAQRPKGDPPCLPRYFAGFP